MLCIILLNNHFPTCYAYSVINLKAYKKGTKPAEGCFWEFYFSSVTLGIIVFFFILIFCASYTIYMSTYVNLVCKLI